MVAAERGLDVMRCPLSTLRLEAAMKSAKGVLKGKFGVDPGACRTSERGQPMARVQGDTDNG